MMVAAAVMTRLVSVWPAITDRRLSPVRTHSSRMRLTRKTW
jgi:hypothetical protein